MKWIIITVSLSFLIPGRGLAKDYMVELFEEHYTEQMLVGGGEFKIYHSWQVKTEFGNKCLIIVGDDHRYRNWLRKYAGNHYLFIIKIPDGGDEKFQYDMAVLLNVQQIHAVWEKRWQCEKCRHGSPPFDPSKPSILPVSEPLESEITGE